MRFSSLAPAYMCAVFGVQGRPDNEDGDGPGWGNWNGWDGGDRDWRDGNGDRGDGWFGLGGPGPSCASSCFSSHWSAAGPTPSALCDEQGSLATCVSSACTSTSAGYDDFTSRLSSGCSGLTSCSSSGTHTYTYVGGWWPYDATSHTSGEVVTVTGCPWGEGDGAWGPWGGHGSGWSKAGWSYATHTETVTVTREGTDQVTESAVLVAEAVSGDETVLSTLAGSAVGAAETSGGAEDVEAGASGHGHPLGLQVVGALLAGAVLVIVML